MIDEKKLIESSTWYPSLLFKGKPTWRDGWNDCNRDWMKRIDELPKVDVPDTNVGEWKRTAEEKPDYTRHVIITYGNSRHASKYGYYFKKEDKWYRDHRCIEEIEPPYAWTEMPEVPEEFVCGMCCG